MADRIIANNGNLELHAIDEENGFVVDTSTGVRYEQHKIASILSKGVWNLLDIPDPIIVTKGGKGSGFRGHAGRPGEVGGSKPEGSFIDERVISLDPEHQAYLAKRRARRAARIAKRKLTEPAPEISKKDIRPDWAQKKEEIKQTFKGLTYAYAYGVGVDEKTYQANAQARKVVIETVEGLSQDERVDLVVSALTDPELLSMPGTHDNLILSRIDKEHSEYLADQLIGVASTFDRRYYAFDSETWNKEHPGQKWKYDKEPDHAEQKKLNDEIGTKNEPAERAGGYLRELTVIGPDDEFRRGLVKKIDEARLYEPDVDDEHGPRDPESVYGPLVPGHTYLRMRDNNAPIAEKKYSVSLSTGDLDKDVAELVDQWCQDSSTILNPLVHHSAMHALGQNVPDRVEVYWTASHQGEILRGPDPGYVAAAKEIYRRTQDYIQRRRKEIPELYRGVSHQVSVRSPLESFSAKESSADEFGKYHIVEHITDPRKIFMTYQSMKGIWPKEGQLRGKQEYVLLENIPGLDTSSWSTYTGHQAAPVHYGYRRRR